VSLFQRIKSPFSESAEEEAPEPEWPVHSVGEMLRERRDQLGVDLETAGGALRIKPIYLAALEQGRPQDLPGPTYAVGFIRAYASYLGFDGAWMLDRYKAETAAVRVRPDLSFPVPLSDRSVPGGPILLVAAILALCGYGTWYYLSTAERARPERVAAIPAELQRELRPPAAATVKTAKPAPHTADGGAQPATGLVTADKPAPPQAEAHDEMANRSADTAPAGPPTAPEGVVAPPPAAAVLPTGIAIPTAPASPGTAAPSGQIDIRAVADCWIQVRDGEQTIVFSRVLKAGETYRVPQPGLVMRVGNAGALAIAVNGKPAPSIGPLGAQRRDVVLDPEALLAGTAVHG
jgi:cytoskeleton protein RodZ